VLIAQSLFQEVDPARLRVDPVGGAQAVAHHQNFALLASTCRKAGYTGRQAKSDQAKCEGVFNFFCSKGKHESCNPRSRRFKSIGSGRAK